MIPAKGACGMLKIFEDHLRRVAAGTWDDFHFQVRKRIGKRATGTLEQRFKDLILLTPRLVARAHEYGASAAVPCGAKKLIGFAVTYFYHPSAFLPKSEEKLFGYLDDAYCVALVYEKILKAFIRNGQKISKSDRNFLAQFKLLKRGFYLIMPEEARKIERMIEGIQTESAYALSRANG
jgi:uncharacterized membrane protein YkvA (DUF1232 family)